MRATIIVLCLAWVAPASPAQAWDPFISKNRNVEHGNEAMAEGDHTGALSRYNDAARELPSEAGVQLDRGLALLASGNLDDARQALLAATEPPASPEIRADAFYDLGLAFYVQGDQVAGQDDHENAQRLFREAADAFRRSLRARPGDRNTAWNLELALRRIQEEQEEQEQQEQNEDEEQNEENRDDSQEDQGSDGDENNDDGGDDSQPSDDPQEEQQQEEPQDSQQGQDGEDERQEDQNQGDEPSSERDGQDEPSQGDGESPAGDSPEDQGQGSEGEPLPDDVARVLDALQNSEESLERLRARSRARRENRRPTKDW